MSSLREEILRLLPKLSEVDLKQIILAAEQLLSPVRIREDSLFYLTFSEVVLIRQDSPLPPLSVIRKTSPSLYAKIAAAEEEIDNWLTKACEGSVLTKQNKRFAYLLAAEILCDYLDRVRAPISAQSLFTNISKLPSLFDQEFPGYRQSGVFYVIFNTAP